jgi:hypothetical protein
MSPSLTQISRSITKPVSSLPLAGKYVVTSLTESLFNSPTEDEARKRFVALGALLLFFNTVHSYQALIGGKELINDALSFCKDPTVLRMAETALDGAYTLINLGVITTNTTLLCRLWQRRLSKGFVSNRSSETRRELGNKESSGMMLGAIFLTFAGQFGMAATVGNTSNSKELRNEPRPAAANPYRASE